ncbi:response regulator transcription factor [Paenibacillus aceris]|uniref:Two-component system response regulator YesN n=1 Tax=Paenibacillus aceris TaxID=869555 RepID=A0ABS4HSJ6_9BACL|nr:response regulator [Paenibacillus aceris]MBP1961603.1 two-component system response regulator YesN [Paenibacillus aceris]NHW37624.1 response regulator [Paenibacillus aceris]
MYKLLIVEDEPLIRTGLKHYFNWQDLHVSHIVEADNGKNGITMALQERPHLIITDIRMPEMDGLEMIEQLRAQLPDTVFVILTGFYEFAYAQQAIRLGGVHAFLLKPLEYEESLATIQSCINEVISQQKQRETHTELVQESKLFKGSEWVQLLLEESDLAVTDEGRLRHLYEFHSDNYRYHPFVITWLPMKSASPPAKNRIKQLSATLIGHAISSLYQADTPRQIITYLYKAKIYGIAILDTSFSSVSQGLTLQESERFIKKVGDGIQTSFFMAIGASTDKLPDLGHLLKQADKALWQRYYQSERHLFLLASGETAHPGKPSAIRLSDQDKTQLYAGLENANEQEIKQLLQRFVKDNLEHLPHTAPQRWMAFLQELIGVCIHFANKNSLPVESVYSDKLLSLAFVDDFPTLDALFDWLGDWMVQLGTIYRDGSLSDQQQDVLIFEHIASFIKQNIAEDVTLQMVADRFFYNPSYLSRLFKRKLDKNYMRFVTEIRIAYAQELLKKPDYLITDVCTMCGYKSYKHFVKTFGIITQMTPTEYRKKWGWS